MKVYIVVACLLASIGAYAQPGSEALAKDNKSLQERFFLLKTKSQTFKDYKVIKETVYDGMWNLLNDSLKANKQRMADARAKIASLDASVAQIKLQLEQKQASMQQVEHASTHITVLGIDFTKGVFITFATVVLLALVAVIGVLVARLKIIHKSYREKADTVDELSHEYEDFKRKAMDKQTKLSRELQDERNKLQSLQRL
jgi:chromosome segregation ATPase